MFSTGERGRFALAMHSFRCPLMGWSGRALAPPASEPCQGRQSQGARYVSATQHDDRRDWYRYRQELVPRCGSRSVRCHCAAAEVVTWPGGITVCQHAALPDRDGGLRRIPWHAHQPLATDISVGDGFDLARQGLDNWTCRVRCIDCRAVALFTGEGWQNEAVSSRRARYLGWTRDHGRVWDRHCHDDCRVGRVVLREKGLRVTPGRTSSFTGRMTPSIAYRALPD